jgi:hypothetical protein
MSQAALGAPTETHGPSPGMLELTVPLAPVAARFGWNRWVPGLKLVSLGNRGEAPELGAGCPDLPFKEKFCHEHAQLLW